MARKIQKSRRTGEVGEDSGVATDRDHSQHGRPSMNCSRILSEYPWRMGLRQNWMKSSGTASTTIGTRGRATNGMDTAQRC